VILSRSTVAMFVSAALLVPPAFASRVHRAPTSGSKSSKSTSSSNSASTKTTASKTVNNSSKNTTSTNKANGLAAAKTKSQSSTGHKTSKRKTAARRPRGQQSIDTDRATQIQQALIREHYLDGEPTGAWDSASVAAMQKYQADQGWQTKVMPDSRALKKLGLGPDYSSAINAKEGNFTAPTPSSAIPTEQASGFAAAAGVNQ